MKEQLADKAVEILTSIQNAVATAGSFAMAQLPDIAQSYVLYGRVMSAVQSGALLLVGIIGLAISLWAYKKPWYKSETSKTRCDNNVGLMAMSGMAGFSFIFIAVANFDFLVWFAPKVWLLKELATLIK